MNPLGGPARQAAGLLLLGLKLEAARLFKGKKGLYQHSLSLPFEVDRVESVGSRADAMSTMTQNRNIGDSKALYKTGTWVVG